MKTFRSWRFILPILSAFLLNSCGAGGMIAGGGIGGTGIISTGVISAFGSIIVNGTKFDTRAAKVIVNGDDLGTGDRLVQDNLDIGRVVTVEGPGDETDHGFVARRVIYSHNVQGPVERIDDIEGTTRELVVLGQTVIVNAITRFKGVSMDTISPNHTVEVSGFRDHTGAIQATFLQKTGEFTPNLIYEVSGYVSNLNIGLQTFMINDLRVDYSLANTSALPDGMPVDGIQVEVEGSLSAAGGKMFASKIEPEDELEFENAEEIEVMGFVTAVISTSKFTLGGQAVVVDDGTEMVDGELTDIVPGVKLEAEGKLEGGILYAHEIEFWEPNQIEVEGSVTDVVSSSKFSVDGQVVATSAETVFEDGNAEDIVNGVEVEIKGRMLHGVLVADKVSFENDEQGE